MADIKIRIGGDASGLKKTLDKSKSDVKSFIDNIPGLGGLSSKLMSPINAALAGIAGVAAAGFAKIKDLADQAANIGMQSGDFQVMNNLFTEQNMGASEVNSTVNAIRKKLQDAIEGNETAIKSFERLGLSISDLARMDALEQFETIARAIADLDTETAQSAASMDMFGKSGKRMLAIVNDLDGALAAAREKPIVSQEGLDAADSIGTSLERLWNVSGKLVGDNTLLQWFAQGASAVAKFGERAATTAQNFFEMQQGLHQLSMLTGFDFDANGNMESEEGRRAKAKFYDDSKKVAEERAKRDKEESDPKNIDTALDSFFAGVDEGARADYAKREEAALKKLAEAAEKRAEAQEAKAAEEETDANIKALREESDRAFNEVMKSGEDFLKKKDSIFGGDRGQSYDSLRGIGANLGAGITLSPFEQKTLFFQESVKETMRRIADSVRDQTPKFTE